MFAYGSSILLDLLGEMIVPFTYDDSLKPHAVVYVFQGEAAALLGRGVATRLGVLMVRHVNTKRGRRSRDEYQ